MADYISKNKQLTRLFNSFLMAKSILAEKAYKAIKNNSSDVNARLDSLNIFLQAYGSKDGTAKVKRIRHMLTRPENRHKILGLLIYIGDEIEATYTEYILARTKVRDPKSNRHELKVKFLSYVRPNKYRGGHYLVANCYLQNPFNIKQILNAPLKKHFTMKFYDFYDIGYGKYKIYKHNPVKTQEV